MASALELLEIRGFVIIVHQNLFCQRGAALMSLAPIEAGEVCQDLLTDHFCPHRWAASVLLVHTAMSWRFHMGGFEGFLYPGVSSL